MLEILLACCLYPLIALVLLGWFSIWLIRRLLTQPAYHYVLLLGLMWLFHEPWTKLPVIAVTTFLLAQAMTFVFDVIHYLLHKWEKSRFAVLRWAASLHQVHHDFLDLELRMHDNLRRPNLWHHVVPEFITHVLVCLAAWWVCGPVPVARNIIVEIIGLGLYLRAGMNDPNHFPHQRLLASQPSMFVDTYYHSLHHFFPDSYFASINNVFDRIFGTGAQLKGLRYVLDEAASVQAKFLIEVLEAHGSTSPHIGLSDQHIESGEIFILLQPGTAEEARMQIEKLKRMTSMRRKRPEIWLFAQNRELDQVSRHYLADPEICYRHIALQKSHAASVNQLLFWARRGFHYIPLGRDGRTAFDYFRFRFARLNG